MKSPEPEVHFYNLDILRFLAVSMVVVFHSYLAYTGWFTDIYFLRNATGAAAKTFILNGDMGVDLFFLISGFLITYLLLRERDTAGKVNVRNFYIRRILRIWPLYFLIVLITPLLVYISDEKAPDYWWTMLFATNFQTIRGAANLFPFVHFWSVCVEEHFYLVWPLLIVLIPAKWLPKCFFVLIIVSIAFRLYTYFEFPEKWYLYSYYHTIARMDILILGAWIGYIHFKSPIVIRCSKSLRIVTYSIFFFILLAESAHPSPSIAAVAFKKYIYACFFIFGLLNYLFNPDSFLNFKKKNFLHYLGRISFGIYMYHNIIFPLIAVKLMRRWECSNLFVFYLVYTFSVLMLSIVSYEFFEKRFLKLKIHFSAIKTLS